MKKKNTTREKEKKVKAHLVTHSWISLSARASRASVCVCVWGGWIFELVGVLFVTEGPDQRFFLRKKKNLSFL